jgi:hypothetical protein
MNNATYKKQKFVIFPMLRIKDRVMNELTTNYDQAKFKVKDYGAINDLP